MSTLQLFPYQRDAVDAVKSAYRGGVRRPALSAATGAGKTIIAAQTINEVDERTLFVAHRKELIDQAQQKIEYVIGKGEVGVVMAERDQADYDIVVASIQTIANPRRLARLGRFGLVIVDEAHHAASPTYRRVLETLGVGKGLPTKGLGVSATWDRADDLGLEHVFDDIVFEVGMEALIRSGHLSDLRAIVVETTLDPKGVSTHDGDYSADAMGKEIVASNYADALARAVVDHASGRNGLVFAPNVLTAGVYADALNAAGVPAKVVTGATPKQEREETIAELRSGAIRLICNVGVFTEGTDFPWIDLIVMGRPTQSRALYQQMAGRGLRRYPGKDHCLLIDLVGVTGQHDLQTAASLLGAPPGTATTDIDSFRDLLDDDDPLGRLMGSGGGVKVMGAVGGAFQQTAREVSVLDRSRLAWEQLDIATYALPAGEAGQVVVTEQQDGTFRVIQYGNDRSQHELASGLDIGYAQGVAEQFIRDAGAAALANPHAAWRQSDAPATEKQLGMLKYLRVKVDRPLTKSEASDLISKAKGKRILRDIKKGTPDGFAHAG